MSDTPPRTTLVRVPAQDAAWTSPDDAFRATVAVPSEVAKAPPLDEPPARYAPRGDLGEGGMGVVRLVADRRIGRDVALKTMRHDCVRVAGVVQRFMTEACVQGQLEHPSIVPVYDLGVDAESMPYFTMKRVHGITLEQIIGQLRSGDAEAAQKYGRRKLLTAFASVCQAIEFAHARGVIHRDLKPSNVMLGDFGEVYVLDWGVAKVTSVNDAQQPAITPPAGTTTRTIVGAAMGTPGYMAPEQARGEANVDQRADVYALGAILFELLCHEALHPRSGAAALASSQMELDAHPSKRAPAAMIPPELDDLCARAAAFHRDARCPSVRDMLDALEHFLDGDRDMERRRELARRHATAASEAAAMALGGGGDVNEARRRALREAGHALALDAENASAAATLVRLLTEPPAEMPEDALAELNAASREMQRGTARGALLGYLAWFAFVPFGFWMGVRSPRVAAASALLWVLAAFSTHLALQRTALSNATRAAAIATTAIAASLTCAVGGPYVLVPTLAVINVMLWLLVSSRAWRPLVIGLGVATVLAPAALDWTHVVRFYNFRDGRVTILQGMLDFPPVATHALFLAASVALVAVTAILITRFRDNLDDAERRLHLQAWQLRHVVPHTVESRAEPR